MKGVNRTLKTDISRVMMLLLMMIIMIMLMMTTIIILVTLGPKRRCEDNAKMDLNHFEPEFYIKILAHSVGKM
jgi:hypothetical protein